MAEYDVLVVGGGFAGLAAATYVARTRRPVLVLDSGAPRNRFAAHSHGFLALDGRGGAELLEAARSQLLAYPSARFVRARVRSVAPRGAFPGFRAETEDRQRFEAKRVVLATGLVDEIPDIPGLAPRWGTSVFHCPYCDGYEVGGGPIGVLATLPLSVHFAKLVSDWGPVTLFTNGAIRLDAAERASLAHRGIAVEERTVVALEGSTDAQLDGVRLADGQLCLIRALFIATRYQQAAPHASELGCAFVENPRGKLVRTDETQLTTVPGVYAAGDMARSTHSIPFAVADGVTAGVSAHQSLVAE